jgi:hypothetical protein
MTWMNKHSVEPYKAWALDYFGAENYVEAAQRARAFILDICDEEGESLAEEFDGTYWELYASPFFGKHTSWEGAIIILAHLHMFDYEGG